MVLLVEYLYFQLDDVMRAKNDLEDRHLKLGREKAELSGQVQENEEDLQVYIPLLLFSYLTISKYIFYFNI